MKERVLSPEIQRKRASRRKKRARALDLLTFVLIGAAAVIFLMPTVLTVTKNTHLTLFEDALYRYLCQLGLTPFMEGSS